METIVIIQARMGSSRFPGKVLMKMGKYDILTYVTERCKKIDGVDLVIVATSNLSQDDEIAKWCIEHDIACYRGSEEDVLQRFVDIAKIYQPKYIVRVTADCPFIDFEMASEMISLIQSKRVDIVDVEEVLPRGIASEVFTSSLLERVNREGNELRHREHVTYYAYEYKNLFTRVNYKVPTKKKYPELRITLDTYEDYEMLTKVAEHFNDIYISTEDVINYLNVNDEIAKINAHIEQKPVI